MGLPSISLGLSYHSSSVWFSSHRSFEKHTPLHKACWAINGRPGKGNRNRQKTQLDNGDFELKKEQNGKPITSKNEFVFEDAQKQARMEELLLMSKKYDDKIGGDPYRILPDGRKIYLDEYDVLMMLDPPRVLKPLKGIRYNPATYMWKKISKIPDDRRHRLLDFLEPRHIERMWKIAGIQYDDNTVFIQDSAVMLPNPDLDPPLKTVKWKGKIFGGSWLWGLIQDFETVFFVGKDRQLYGRFISGGKLFMSIARYFAPLYFEVRSSKHVPNTKELCDLVFDFYSGQSLHQNLLPGGFVKPVEPLWPSNKNVMACIRPIGPGIFAGRLLDKSVSPNPSPILGEFVLIRIVDASL